MVSLFRSMLLFLLLSACTASSRPAATSPACRTHDDGLAFWKQGDYAAAADCWRPLAEAGNARDRMALGLALDRQFTDGPDDSKRGEAEHWLTLAAEQQLPNAEYELGGFLLRRWCQPQHERCQLARDWLERAAMHGHWEARGMLVDFYLDPALGQGNTVRAAFWNEVLARTSGGRFNARRQYLEAQIPAYDRYFNYYGVDFLSLHFSDTIVYTGNIGTYQGYWFGYHGCVTIPPNYAATPFIDPLAELVRWGDVHEVEANARRQCKDLFPALRRMAETGNVMAAYQLAEILYKYNDIAMEYNTQGTGRGPLLPDENTNAWLDLAIQQGMADALELKTTKLGWDCWIRTPSVCSTILPLLLRGARMGNWPSIYWTIKLPVLDGNYAEIKEFYYLYATRKEFMTPCRGRGCMNYFNLDDIDRYLNEEKKEKLEMDVAKWEPDYP